MKKAIIAIMFILAFFFGAVQHEKDLARNYNETGDAKAWFYEIKEVK